MPLQGTSGGGSGGAGAIRAGAAYVELFARDRIGGTLDRLAARLQAFGAVAIKAGAGLTAAGIGAVAAVAAPLQAATDRARLVERLSDTLQTSAENVTATAYAFERFGVSLEQFGEVANDLQAKIADGAGALLEFGLNAQSLAKMQLPDQLAALADHMQRLGTGDRAALAERLGIKQLLPLLSKGSSELARLQDEAFDVGAVMSGSTAKEAADLGRAFDATWAAMKMSILEVGLALLPQADNMHKVAAGIRAAAAAADVREWINDNQEIIQITAAVGLGLIAAGIAATALGIAMKGAALGVAVLAAAVKLLGLAFLVLTNPIGLAVAAVAALGYVFATETETGQRAVSGLRRGFEEFAATAKETWSGVAAAMRKGDFGLAASIAFAGIKLEWLKVEKWWVNAWNSFKGTFVDGWHSLGTAIRLVLNDLAAWLLRNTLGSLNALLNRLADAAAAIGAGDIAGQLRNAASGVLSDDEINKARDQIRDDERRDAARRQADRDASRQGDADAANAAIESARRRLAELIAQANEQQGRPPPAAEQARRMLPASDTVFSAIRGVSNTSRLADQLGIGDKTGPQRQLKAAEATAANTAVLPDVRRALGDVADALQFG